MLLLKVARGLTIKGHSVIVMDDLKKEMPHLFNESGAMDYAKFETDIRPRFPIQVRLDKQSIAFTNPTPQMLREAADILEGYGSDLQAEVDKGFNGEAK